MAHAGGRPVKYSTAEELEVLIDKYFEDEKVPTMAGLAYYLGLSRQGLLEYSRKDEFSDLLKRARQKIELLYEEKLLTTTTPTGVIFALKNMYWKDRQDVTTNDKDLPTPILPNIKTNQDS